MSEIEILTVAETIGLIAYLIWDGHRIRDRHRKEIRFWQQRDAFWLRNSLGQSPAVESEDDLSGE